MPKITIFYLLCQQNFFVKFHIFEKSFFAYESLTTFQKYQNENFSNIVNFFSFSKFFLVGDNMCDGSPMACTCRWPISRFTQIYKFPCLFAIIRFSDKANLRYFCLSLLDNQVKAFPFKKRLDFQTLSYIYFIG